MFHHLKQLILERIGSDLASFGPLNVSGEVMVFTDVNNYQFWVELYAV